MLLNNFHCDFNYTASPIWQSNAQFLSQSLAKGCLPSSWRTLCEKKNLLYSVNHEISCLWFHPKTIPKIFHQTHHNPHCSPRLFRLGKILNSMKVTNPAKPSHLEQKLSKFLPTNFFEVDSKFVALHQNISPAMFALTKGYFWEHQL